MAAKTDTWMPLYIADYLADTMHLTTRQHGAYLLLIMHAWRNGGCIPADPEEQAAVARMSRKDWDKEGAAVRRLFGEDDNGPYSKRVREELGIATAVQRQRSGAGKAAAAKRQREFNGKATGEQREGQQNAAPSQSPSPSHDLTPTPSVANSARGRATEPARASLIREDWQPSEIAIAQLRKGRPDLVGAFFDQRMTDFRLWCRDKAVMSHDPEAAWLGFMRKSLAAPTNGEQRRAREIEETMDYVRQYEADLKAREAS